MIKQLIVIILLVVGIGGVSYYGYTIYMAGGVSNAFLDSELAFFDGALSEMEAFSVTDEELAEIDGLKAEMDAEDTRPVTTSEMDTLLKELDGFSKTDTALYNLQLTDI